MTDKDQRGRLLAGISEVVLRVDDLETMVAFYRDVVGLEIFQRSGGLVFFKVAELASPLGEGGHPQLMALVDRDQNPWPWRGLAYRNIDPRRSVLDHLAFEIREEDFEGERERLERLGEAAASTSVTPRAICSSWPRPGCGRCIEPRQEEAFPAA